MINRIKTPTIQDPWLRNEVWRYDTRHPLVGGTRGQRTLMAVGFKGMKYGLAIALVTAGNLK